MLKWLGHSSFLLISDNKTIYIDPLRNNRLINTKLDPFIKADIILITHKHWDHCDTEAVISLLKKTTIIIAPEEIMEKFLAEASFYFLDISELSDFLKKIKIVNPKNKLIFGNIKIEILNATEGVSFLVKAGKKYLFMGDSIISKNMIKTDPDIILIPYWAIKHKNEQKKISEFSKLSIIFVTHYHENENGFANFYIEREKLIEITSNVSNIKLFR